MIINVNDYVKVKLNEVGVTILRKEHEEDQKYKPKPEQFTLPEVDSDGYTRYQLHELMRIFGPHISHMLSLGFHTDIHTTEGK